MILFCVGLKSKENNLNPIAFALLPGTAHVAAEGLQCT